MSCFYSILVFCKEWRGHIVPAASAYFWTVLWGVLLHRFDNLPVQLNFMLLGTYVPQWVLIWEEGFGSYPMQLCNFWRFFSLLETRDLFARVWHIQFFSNRWHLAFSQEVQNGYLIFSQSLSLQQAYLEEKRSRLGAEISHDCTNTSKSTPIRVSPGPSFSDIFRFSHLWSWLSKFIVTPPDLGNLI